MIQSWGKRSLEKSNWVGFSGRQTLRLRFMFRKLLRECAVEQHLLGGKGGRAGQKEKSNLSVRSLRLGCLFSQSWVEAKGLVLSTSLYLPLDAMWKERSGFLAAQLGAVRSLHSQKLEEPMPPFWRVGASGQCTPAPAVSAAQSGEYVGRRRGGTIHPT